MVTMTLWIGRCGLDVALDDPDSFDFAGPDGFTITGVLFNATIADAKALRQQLLGHVGDVVPVWHDEDTTTGCYARLQSASVKASGGDELNSLVTASFPFSATFSESYGQLPLIELRCFGPSRDTATGTPQGVVGQPDASDAQLFTGNTALGSEDRNGRDPIAGTADTVHTFITTSTQLNDSYNSFVCPPRNFWDMAPTLIIDGQVITGRGRVADIVNNLADWQLNNGLLKVEPGATGMLKITCQDQTGTSANWGSASCEFTPQFYAGGAWANIGQGTPPLIDKIDVDTNEAHEVSARLVCTILQPAKIRANIDLTLRRGCRHLEIGVSCYLTFPLGLVAHTGSWTTTGASAQVLWQDANNADGNRYAMFSKETRDGANKRMGTSGTSRNYSQFGVAGIIDGDAASGNETEQNIRDQYNAAIEERGPRFVRA